MSDHALLGFLLVISIVVAMVGVIFMTVMLRESQRLTRAVAGRVYPEGEKTRAAIGGRPPRLSPAHPFCSRPPGAPTDVMLRIVSGTARRARGSPADPGKMDGPGLVRADAMKERERFPRREIQSRPRWPRADAGDGVLGTAPVR